MSGPYDRLMTGVYQKMMGTNAVRTGFELTPAIVAADRNATAEDVLELFRDATTSGWGPAAMGAWLSILHAGDERVIEAVLAAFDQSTDDQAGVPLALAAALVAGDRALPHLHAHIERFRNTPRGMPEFAAAAMNHLGASTDVEPDEQTFRAMVRVADVLKGWSRWGLASIDDGAPPSIALLRFQRLLVCGTSGDIYDRNRFSTYMAAFSYRWRLSLTRLRSESLVPEPGDTVLWRSRSRSGQRVTWGGPTLVIAVRHAEREGVADILFLEDLSMATRPSTSEVDDWIFGKDDGEDDYVVPDAYVVPPGAVADVLTYWGLALPYA